MPSTHIHSPASPADARGRLLTCESPGISDPLAVLAAQQAAAVDAWMTSPEFARHQAGQQQLIADLIRQADAACDLLYPVQNGMVQRIRRVRDAAIDTLLSDHSLAMPRRQDADGTRGDHRDQ